MIDSIKNSIEKREKFQKHQFDTITYFLKRMVISDTKRANAIYDSLRLFIESDYRDCDPETIFQYGVLYGITEEAHEKLQKQHNNKSIANALDKIINDEDFCALFKIFKYDVEFKEDNLYTKANIDIGKFRDYIWYLEDNKFIIARHTAYHKYYKLTDLGIELYQEYIKFLKWLE